MKIINEFKTFAMRGNVIDMAVGIIIGVAFGKIISSIVADVIMPPVGLLVGGIDFTDINITLRSVVTDPETGAIIRDAVMIKIGNFIQALVDFIIIAWVIFVMIKGINRLSRKKEESAPEPPPTPPVPTKEEELLTEIRDILKNK